jgi:RNA polymerase sigma factor (sigma-70 family)
MLENKPFYIKIDGQPVEVTEDVYRAYKRPAWAERKRRAVRAERERSFEAFTDAGLDIPDSCPPVEETAEGHINKEELYRALAKLTADEHRLVDALFFEEKTEREYAAETGVPNATVHSRKTAILKKLKKFL